MSITKRIRDSRRAKRQKKENALFQRLEVQQRQILLTDKNVASTRPGVGNEAKHEIILSLTSFDKRIESSFLAIESLMQQTLLADRIVLCIAKDDFPGHTIPASLRRQEARGLEILLCEKDLGPYTKYYYTFKKYPDSLIITVDDDILYPANTVDLLYRAYLNQPEVIHGLRTHSMRVGSDGQLLPYQKWSRDRNDFTPSMKVFPTGVGGVLYFPGCMDPDVLNQEAFLKLCPNSDDIWLKAMSLKKGTACAQVNGGTNTPTFLAASNTQAHCLKRKNKQSGGNDSKLKTVFDAYQLWDRIKA